MSDQSQGPGWWQASDGKWYPPEQAPAAPPEAPPTQPFGATPPAEPMAAPGPIGGPGPAPAGPPPGGPSRSGLGAGPIIAIVVAALALIAAVVFFATKDDGNKKNAAATNSSSSSVSSSSRSSSSRSSSSKSSSSSSGAPKISAPPGFTAFSDDTDRFAIAIPDHLRVIDLTSADLDKVLQQLSDSNPKLAALAPQIKQVFQNGGKLFAIDTGSGGDFNDNVNIIATPGTVDVTSPSVKSQAEAQLGSIDATNVAFDTIETGAGTALTSSYQANVNTADGTPITFTGRQAIVSAGGKLWFITYSTGVDDPDGFRTMLQSFDVNS